MPSAQSWWDLLARNTYGVSISRFCSGTAIGWGRGCTRLEKKSFNLQVLLFPISASLNMFTNDRTRCFDFYFLLLWELSKWLWSAMQVVLQVHHDRTRSFDFFDESLVTGFDMLCMWSCKFTIHRTKSFIFFESLLNGFGVLCRWSCKFWFCVDRIN